MTNGLKKLITRLDEIEPLQAGFAPVFLTTEIPLLKPVKSKAIAKFLTDMETVYVPAG